MCVCVSIHASTSQEISRQQPPRVLGCVGGVFGGGSRSQGPRDKQLERAIGIRNACQKGVKGVAKCQTRIRENPTSQLDLQLASDRFKKSRNQEIKASWISKMVNGNLDWKRTLLHDPSLYATSLDVYTTIYGYIIHRKALRIDTRQENSIKFRKIIRKYISNLSTLFHKISSKKEEIINI